MSARDHAAPADALFSALGIGPEAALLHEPRLLLDPQFLGGLLAELDDELGSDSAGLTFFQLGFLHGLRDAQRVMSASFHEDGFSTGIGGADAPPLAMSLGGRHRDPETGGITLSGSWPERFEANARMARLGPEDGPCCSLSAGYTSGWLTGTLETDILVCEQTCSARGDEICSFRAAEPIVWESSGHAPAQDLLQRVTIPALREIVAQAHVATYTDPGAFDPDDPAVHTWGPVMVLPFIGPDDALATIEMLSSNPDTCSARVVVIDLRGVDLDEGFGAAALEQILERVESWGADSILTGVSQLSEAVVQGLEVSHCILRKDLSEAVASAFQLADAQRHLL